MDKSYKHLGYFFLLLIPLSIAGFYKSYVGIFPHFPENITIYVHIHAALATIWITMLIIQPFLAAGKKFSTHRKLGKLSYIIFSLLILSFIPQIIRTAKSEFAIYNFFPVADCVLLILFYSLAVYHKRNSARHMRYMIGTALVFLGPTIGRIGPNLFELSSFTTQHIQYSIIYFILISLIFYDRSKGKKFQPYIVVTGGFLAHQLVFYYLFL